MRNGRNRLMFLLALCWLLMGCLCFAAPYSRWPEVPAKGVQEADLVGIWYVNYAEYTAEHGGVYHRLCSEEEASRLTEVLILDLDGNYRQIFWNREDGKAKAISGRWWLERLPDGVVRVHLEGGRSYPFENCRAIGSVGRSYSNDLTGHELTVDATKEAVLQVWTNQFKSGLYLAYPYVGNPDAPVIVCLRRLTP